MGPGSKFVGELTGEEDVLVQGRFEGTLRVGAHVTVGPGGQIEGDIHARTVLVYGHVRGQIFGDERVELFATAVVEGNVEAPKIVLAEGARLEGSVAMGSREERGAPRSSEA